MSVSSRIFIGVTLEFATNLKYADFRKADAFIEAHPELDEYAYNLRTEAEGKLVLICDGMNGHYLRLIQIDKCTYDTHTGYEKDMLDLANHPIPEATIQKFAELYKEYTGNNVDVDQIKYSMWTQWY